MIEVIYSVDPSVSLYDIVMLMFALTGALAAATIPFMAFMYSRRNKEQEIMMCEVTKFRGDLADLKVKLEQQEHNRRVQDNSHAELVGQINNLVGGADRAFKEIGDRLSRVESK